MRTEYVYILHAENCVPGEKRTQDYSVDGYCEETNTVYEYLGCYHHGHSCKYDDPKEILDTLIRKGALASLGYNVVTIYSCEWENYGMNIDLQHTPPVSTVKDVENAILSNELFGYVKCEIHVPDHLIDYFSEHLQKLLR